MIIKDIALADRLNQLNNSTFNCNCGQTHKLPVTFYGGNYLSNIKSVISSRIPYGKVAFVGREKEYLEFATPVQNAVFSVGGKFIGLVYDGDADSVDGASELFNLPDDVRAVITFGEELFGLCSYYATVKDILLIVLPTTLNVAYSLSVKTQLANGDGVDRVDVSAERFVILDLNIIDTDTIPQAYAFIMSKLTALADYRLYSAVYNLEPCKYAYGLIKKAVISTFGIINVDPCNIAITLLEYTAYVGIANGVTSGAFYDFDGVSVSSRLYGKDADYGVGLYISIKLMDVYDLFLNGGEENLLALPEYNDRAEFFSKNYPFPERQIVKNLITQIRAIRRGEKKLNSVIKALKVEVHTNVAFAENIMKVYVALGGKVPEIDYDRLKLAVKHGGDAPYFLNGLSIARAKGVLEYI